eukprot:scaffold52333_cov56-Phaeocystis_antarctica.AAC.6
MSNDRNSMRLRCDTRLLIKNPGHLAPHKYLLVCWAKDEGVILAQVNSLKSRQRPTAQRRGEGGASCIRDMSRADVEDLEHLEHACHGLGDQGGQALVADLVVPHVESRYGQLAQRMGQCQ